MPRTLPLLLALCLFSGLAAAEDEPWLDLSKCGMCKNLGATPGMIEAVSWKHYAIDSGMMSVAVVPDDFDEAWHGAKEAMHAEGQKMMAGDPMELCQHCMSMGRILQTGNANMEVIQTIAGEITLLTSSDAGTIAMIQEHAKHTVAALERMGVGTGER